MDNSPDTTLLLATAVQETWIVLHGAGAACGSIAGRARVLVMPDDVSQLQPGEILVVSSATKGWEPACACAAAMVGDSGGMLCTLARRAPGADSSCVRYDPGYNRDPNRGSPCG